MENIKVRKSKLLRILRKNRLEHRQVFLEALEGWKTRVTAELDRRLQLAKARKAYEVHINLPQPEDHTKDYDRVIGMLELTSQRVIVVDEQMYQQFVEDRWGWQERFLGTASAYLSSASNMKLTRKYGGPDA